MTDLRCIDCLQPAVVQFVVGAGNVPIGTLCQECWDNHKRLHEAIVQMLETALEQ